MQLTPCAAPQQSWFCPAWQRPPIEAHAAMAGAPHTRLVPPSAGTQLPLQQSAPVVHDAPNPWQGDSAQ